MDKEKRPVGRPKSKNPKVKNTITMDKKDWILLDSFNLSRGNVISMLLEQYFNNKNDEK